MSPALFLAKYYVALLIYGLCASAFTRSLDVSVPVYVSFFWHFVILFAVFYLHFKKAHLHCDDEELLLIFMGIGIPQVMTVMLTMEYSGFMPTEILASMALVLVSNLGALLAARHLFKRVLSHH